MIGRESVRRPSRYVEVFRCRGPAPKGGGDTESILRAARDVFIAKFHEATTHDVARAAGSQSDRSTPISRARTSSSGRRARANRADDAVLRDIAPGVVRTKLSRAIAGWYRYTMGAGGADFPRKHGRRRRGSR